MKMLAILDDPKMMEGISFTLELRWPQLDLVSAREGSRGIEMVAAESPDIALLDTALPDMDGLETLSQIRAFSDVPVIVISDRGEEMERVRGLTLGADDYVVKPVGCLELSERVAAVLRRTSPAVLVHRLPAAKDEPGLPRMETERPRGPWFPTASSLMSEYSPHSWLILNILKHFRDFS